MTFFIFPKFYRYSPLSSPDDPEKLSRSKISAIHRYSDSFVTEPCSDSRNRMSYDSLDYIDVSPSHFTLPSYAHSRAYIDEEAEMDNLVHKMEQVFPSNLSYSGIVHLENATRILYCSYRKWGRFYKATYLT